MPGIGRFVDRVTILTRTLAAADASGEEVESWPDPPPGTGRHAAELTQADSPDTRDNGLRQTGGAATIRIQGRPAVASVDRVRDEGSGTVYGIDSVRFDRPAWETVLQCTAITW
jgi:head-tail adaptor